MPQGAAARPQPQPQRPSPRHRPLRAVLTGLLAVTLISGGGVVRAFWQAPAQTAGTAAAGTPGPTRPATPADVSSVAATVSPAVVDITSTLGLRGGHAAGTGIVLTSTGEVLTNNHVIAGATDISATDVGNGRTYRASVVGYDRSDDIAVLRLRDASGLRTAPIGDSSRVAVGNGVVAVGNAGGVGGAPSLVTGTVTGLNRPITATDDSGANAERLTGLIEVAADIRPGHSGGPLADNTAHVIGMDTAASAGFGLEGSGRTGYAIPINQAIAITKQIEAGRGSSTVHIGATGILGVQVASRPGVGGAVVAAVVPGSPAEAAGLASGDVIVSLDGHVVDAPETLTTLLESHHPGDRVSVSWRDLSGRSRTAQVGLATGPAA
ncbi:MAG TPA: trypsin-like peptidase domain-containing protein [Planosporangium sp.]|nr:trypsin-like peptidase domain-containing protein [Planosporangium sp.]